MSGSDWASGDWLRSSDPEEFLAGAKQAFRLLAAFAQWALTSGIDDGQLPAEPWETFLAELRPLLRMTEGTATPEELLRSVDAVRKLIVGFELEGYFHTQLVEKFPELDVVVQLLFPSTLARESPPSHEVVEPSPPPDVDEGRTRGVLWGDSSPPPVDKLEEGVGWDYLAEQPGEEAGKRYANLVLVEPVSQLPVREYVVKPDQDVDLRVDIGPWVKESLVASPFPEDKLPPDQAGHWIDVVVSSSDFSVNGDQAAHARLHLPADVTKPATTVRGGEGERFLHFRLRVLKEAGLAAVRVSFYYEYNLLQSFKLEGEVGGPNPLRAAEEPDYMLTQSLAGLSRFAPRRVSILTNDNPDGSHQLQVFGKGRDDLEFTTTYQLDATAVGKQVNAVRQVLKAIAPTQEQRTRQQLESDLRKLAPVCRELYRGVVAHIADRFDLRKALKQEEALVIQVGRPRAAEYVFPWGLMYDIPLDTAVKPQDLALCPIVETWDTAAVKQWVAEGRRHCPTVKPGEAHASHQLCPFGFWGYRFAIEQPPSTAGAVTDIPVGAQSLEMVAALTQDLDSGAKREALAGHMSWLEGKLKDIKLRVGDTREQIKEQLADPDLQLVYFFCHGHYSDRDEGETYLGIGKHEKLSGGDFIDWQEAWFDELDIRVWDQIRPLIFINACHSLAIEPDELVSLLDVFVGNGRAAGVIGTEARVYQPLAIKAAQMFFDLFVNQRKPVGEALHHLRLHFLSQGNLFGLVYTPYCLADLHLV